MIAKARQVYSINRRKVENVIAAPKGYDSKEKDLEECVMNTDVGIVPHFINKHFHPDGCTHKYFGNEGV